MYIQVYRAVQNTFVLTEVLRRKRVNLSFYLWSDNSEEFHLGEITYYDYITVTITGSGA